MDKKDYTPYIANEGVGVFDEDEFDEVYSYYRGYTILKASLNPHNSEYCIQELGFKKRWNSFEKCKKYIRVVLNKEDFE